MKMQCIQKKFRDDTEQVIAQAGAIMDEYAELGYDLTLRQLYYQFVARDLIANTQREYKRLGSIINDGRLAGQLDWDIMVDRTRELRGITHWDSAGQIVTACANQFRYDTRADQPYYIEVWVEKEALAGIVVEACDDLDVHCLVCRGFVSQSAMWQAYKRFKGTRRPNYIVYLGDHDPSGLAMPTDIHGRLNGTFGVPVSIVRAALTLGQIRRHRCPPNPAKQTDSRYDDYRADHGDHSWELDALEPQVLDAIIREAVNKLTDHIKREAWIEAQEETRERLQEIAGEL